MFCFGLVFVTIKTTAAYRQLGGKAVGKELSGIFLIGVGLCLL